MIRPFGKLVLTLGTVALMASPALAQGGRGGFGGGVGFLMAPNVQKDLKLTDEQVGKVQDTLADVREKHQGDYAGLRDASPEERQTKMLAISKTVNGEVKKALSLSDEQSKRFDQISLQASGLTAYSDPSVAEKLKLTGEQKTKIKEIAQASAQRGAGGFAALKDASKEEREAAVRKMAETRKENLAKVHGLLTDDQKKAWKELTGEPIEIPLTGGGRRPNN